MNKAFRSKILLVFLLAILILLCVLLYNQWLVKNKLEVRLNNLKQEAEKLNLENQQIELDLSNISDEKQMEKFLRETYLLKKPGEKTFVIPEDLFNTN